MAAAECQSKGILSYKLTCEPLQKYYVKGVHYSRRQHEVEDVAPPKYQHNWTSSELYLKSQFDYTQYNNMIVCKQVI